MFASGFRRFPSDWDDLPGPTEFRVKFPGMPPIPQFAIGTIARVIRRLSSDFFMSEFTGFQRAVTSESAAAIGLQTK